MVDEMSDPTIGSPGERDLRALQEVRWRAQRDRVAARSAFYRRTGRAFDGVGLDGLVAVEPTRKEELLASQAEYGPFGDYLACDERELRRIHRTSGLTGRGLVLAQTAADTAVTHVVGGRSMIAAVFCFLRHPAVIRLPYVPPTAGSCGPSALPSGSESLTTACVVL